MSVIKTTITGTINIPHQEAAKLDWFEYVYIFDDKEPMCSASINTKTKELQLPRNLGKFNRILKEQNLQYSLVDKRVEKTLSKPINLREGFTLRDYQAKPVKEILRTLKNSEDHSCILKADPGFGKSFILPVVLKALKQRCLIIVDRTNLQAQMFSEFKTNMVNSTQVQTLTKDTKKLLDVNIATAQLLIKNKRLLRMAAKEIGIVVVDEMHIMSIGAFTDIVNNIPAKYRLGLSATPSRSDGLTEAMFDVMGEHIVNGFNPNYVGIQYLFVKYPYIAYGQHSSPIKAIIAMFSHPKLVLDACTTAVKLHKKGRTVLIYATYEKVQKAVYATIKAMGLSCEIINKDVSAKNKIQIFEDFNNRKIDVVVSGVTSNKGISIHNLDTIINLSNHTKESLEQLAGRLRREAKNKKKPIYIDFILNGIGLKKSLLKIDIVDYIVHKTKKDKKNTWTYEKFSEKFL